MTAKLSNRGQKAPLIISSFQAGWDAQSLLTVLEVSERVEVLDAPSYLTLDNSKARFEKASFAPVAAEAGAGVKAELDRVGVRVDLSPSVSTSGRIRMRVSAQAVTPDASHTVKIGDATLPRETVRRSESELELVDGQS